PTTVMVGAEDGPFVETAEELARVIPGARHEVIPTAGHQPQLENPAVWTEIVRQHVKGARGGA
ncbi:MAG: alpha/beta hydrolase, partial [Myxococcales bacterium]|nr:alpha/beta hydrolase [Myxococcales bacterium]